MKKRIFLVLLFVLAIGQHAGAQWQSIGLSSGVGALAFAADGTLYASSVDGMYHRNPQTLAWEKRDTGLGGQIIPALVADPHSPGTLYAGSVGGFGVDSPPRGIFKTIDGGLTWTRASVGLPSSGITDGIRVLALDPTDSATLYAGTDGGGVQKTTNAAGSWSSANSGLTDPSVLSVAIDPNNTSTLYAGTVDGVFKSTDGGLSWSPKNVGLRAERMPFTAAGFVIDPTNTSTLYLASFVPISFPVGGGVYKSTDGAETWTQVNNGILPVAMSAIVLDPRPPATIYAAFQTGGVVKTTDGGAHWSGASTGLPYPVLALAVDPNGSGTIYAATSGGVFQLTPGTGNTCIPGPDTLCLNGSRFKVQVNWRVASQATSGTGKAALMTSDSGSFWFFSSNNVELVVKVVDGRAFNNRFWVFYGALTNVEYTITVTDTQTGAVKTYFNPQGQLASVADTAAFSP